MIIMLFSGALYMKSNQIADTANLISRHPLVVSNTASQMNTNIIKMHRSMKDAVLASSEYELDEAITIVNNLELKTLSELDIIDQYILGEEGQQLAREAREAFINWRPIRNNVIVHLKNGDHYEAEAITKNEGALYIESLEIKFNSLNLYAIEKSEGFIDSINEDNSLLVIYIFIGMFISIILISLVNYYLGRGILSFISSFSNEISRIIQTKEYIFKPRKNIKEFEEIEDNFGVLTQMIKEEFWVKDGLGTIQDQLINNDTVEEIAKKSLAFLCKYTNSVAGVCYFYTENKKDFIAYESYAEEGYKSQYLSNGIIEEIAMTKNKRVFNDISNNDASFNTKLLTGIPNTLVICPLINQNLESIGVIEVAFIEKPDDAVITFVEQVGVVIGTYYEGSKQLEKINTLLEDAQIANESLYTQSSELEKNARVLESNQVELEENQSELEKINQELERQQIVLVNKNSELEELRDTLIIKSKELAKASNLKTEFLMNMSHELRTPLNTIILLSSSLLDKNNMDKNIREKINVISTAGDELLKIINNVLDISKIENGMMETYVEKINIEEFVNRIASKYEILSKEKNIAFETIIQIDKELEVSTDLQKLTQIINNLLSNAFKFTDKGSVSLIVQNSKYVGMELDIIVRDTGIGITEERQKIIFDQFVQSDGSITRNYGGTGLGLAISDHFTQLIGGSIFVESDLDKGSVFTLSIPQKVENNNDTREMLPIRRQEEFTNTFLVIDDDSMYTNKIEKTLYEMNYEVLVARTGYDGVSMAEDTKPDFIILDLMLPDITGERVIKELKNNAATRMIPVIVITGRTNYNEINILKEGAIACIQKNDSFNKDIDFILKHANAFIKEENKEILYIYNESSSENSLEKIMDDDIKVTKIMFSDFKEGQLKKSKYNLIVMNLVSAEDECKHVCKQFKESNIKIPIVIYAPTDVIEKKKNEIKLYSNEMIIKVVSTVGELLQVLAIYLHNDAYTENATKNNFMNGNSKMENKKVLICDDDSKNVFTLTTLLQEWGLVVDSAYNGKDAIEKVNEEDNYSLVLMDIMMPEMDGYETIKKIRKIKGKENLPIIALTAKVMKGDREKCLSIGASDYLGKPIEPTILRKLIEIWID